MRGLRYLYSTKPGRLLSFTMAFLVAGLAISSFVFASGETISGSDSFTTEVKTASAIGGISINGSDNSTVPVKLRVSSGTLAMATTTGLTFSGSQTGSTLYFSGARSDVNAALATLSYTRTTTGSDTLEVSLVSPGEVFFSGTGHLYEYVSSTLTWNQAKTAAEARSKYGANGYLTTITSQAENDFVSARLANAGWMGASDSGSEGAWKWVTGPENGTTFSNGNSPSMTAVSGQYQNWNSGEPNDSGSNEDCGQFLAGGTGKWNDLPCNSGTLPGYVVEYGATGNMPSVAAKNIPITTSDSIAPATPGTPSTTTPTTSLKPTWTWTASSDSGTGLANPAYTLEWSQSSSFAGGVSSATTNSTSYAHTVNLSDGTWYFRVRASDAAGNNSSYSATGSVVIDTTAPGTASFSGSTFKTNSATPALSWSAASDNGTGLADPAYTVQRSQSSTFAGGVTTTTTNSNLAYTMPTLSEGTWYVRIRAADQVGNTSAWSSTLTVVVDLTAPAAPGTPSTTSPTNNKRPTWSWTASADSGAGLASPAYSLQWSQSSSFASGVSGTTTDDTSYAMTSDLADGTWYFRVMASDQAGNNSSYSASGSVVVDATLAVLSTISATANGPSGQTISWTTDEPSSSRILYGPTTAYDSDTGEIDTAPKVTSHSIQLSGLTPCTLYHYQVVSTDTVGNVTSSADSSFITAGCAGAAAVIDHTESQLDANTGGNVVLPVGGSSVKLQVPANFSSYDADFQIKQIDPAAALAVIGSPSNLTTVGKAYDLRAMKDTTTPISSFAYDVTVTLPYEPADVAQLIESSLIIYRWDDGVGWQALSNCHVDTDAHTVTCTTPGFSTFVLFGSLKPVTAATTTKPVATRKIARTNTGDGTASANANPDTATNTHPAQTRQPAAGDSAANDSKSTVPAKRSQHHWWLVVGIIVVFIGSFFLILIARRRRKKSEQAQQG